MRFENGSARSGGSRIATIQQPSSANSPVKRSRNGISKKRKSFAARFLFTFGTEKGFERLKKVTQNFFEFVSMVVLGVAGVIALIIAALSLWR
jgi:hypothetical protein